MFPDEGGQKHLVRDTKLISGCVVNNTTVYV